MRTQGLAETRSGCRGGAGGGFRGGLRRGVGGGDEDGFAGEGQGEVGEHGLEGFLRHADEADEESAGARRG